MALFHCSASYLRTAETQPKPNDFDESDAEKHIGLVGETGSGKTSFINAIMRYASMHITFKAVCTVSFVKLHLIVTVP